MDLGGEGRMGGVKEGNCGWDVLYERTFSVRKCFRGRAVTELFCDRH